MNDENGIRTNHENVENVIDGNRKDIGKDAHVKDGVETSSNK